MELIAVDVATNTEVPITDMRAHSPYTEEICIMKMHTWEECGRIRMHTVELSLPLRLWRIDGKVVRGAVSDGVMHYLLQS